MGKSKFKTDKTTAVQKSTFAFDEPEEILISNVQFDEIQQEQTEENETEHFTGGFEEIDGIPVVPELVTEPVMTEKERKRRIKKAKKLHPELGTLESTILVDKIKQTKTVDGGGSVVPYFLERVKTDEKGKINQNSLFSKMEAEGELGSVKTSKFTALKFAKDTVSELSNMDLNPYLFEDKEMFFKNFDKIKVNAEKFEHLKALLAETGYMEEIEEEEEKAKIAALLKTAQSYSNCYKFSVMRFGIDENGNGLPGLDEKKLGNALRRAIEKYRDDAFKSDRVVVYNAFDKVYGSGSKQEKTKYNKTNDFFSKQYHIFDNMVNERMESIKEALKAKYEPLRDDLELEKDEKIRKEKEISLDETFAKEISINYNLTRQELAKANPALFKDYMTNFRVQAHGQVSMNYGITGSKSRMSEALSRSNEVMDHYKGSTWSEEEYKEMYYNIGASEETEDSFETARRKNIRGMKKLKEAVRVHYHYLADKYGGNLETMDFREFAERLPEIVADLKNIQVDTSMRTRVPEMWEDNEQDNILKALITYFNMVGGKIGVFGSMQSGSYSPQHDFIHNMKQIWAKDNEFGPAKEFLKNQGLI
jgi:ribosomal protein S13